MIDPYMLDLLRGPSQQSSPMLEQPPPMKMAGDVIKVPGMQGPGPNPGAMLQAEQALRINPGANVVPMGMDRYKLWLENLKGRYGVK